MSTSRPIPTTAPAPMSHPTEGIILDSSFGTPSHRPGCTCPATTTAVRPSSTEPNEKRSSPCPHCGANNDVVRISTGTAAETLVDQDGTVSRTEASGRIGQTDLEKGKPVTAAFDFPDGGWRAWLVVAGAWCVSFTTWGYTNAFGVSVSWYLDHQLQGRTESDIAWIGSFQLAMVLCAAVVSGKAFDAGYIKYLLVTGTCLYTLGLFGLAYSTNYWQIFLAQGVACGLAAGILFLPAVSAVSHYFRIRRATALGVLATGSSVGGIVYPLLLNKNFSRIGFPAAIRASGYLTVGLLVFACFSINSRLPPRTKGPILDFSHFRVPEYSIFVIGECLIMWGLYLPYFYTQQYALQNGVDSQIALYSLSILNAASLFGRVIPNYLADRFGPFTILIPNCFISSIFVFGWLGLVKSNAGTVIFCVAYGVSSGAYVSMMPACIASITTDMSQIGIRIAMAFVCVALPALTGTPICGAIVASQNGSYTGAAIFAGICIFIGTAVNCVAWKLISNRKGTIWV